MSDNVLSAIISSRSRLKIADFISTRPRGLEELAAATGISMQGVLKHLKKLKSIGIVDERSIRSPILAARKVYVASGVRLRDFSSGDLTLVKLSGRPPVSASELVRYPDLEYLAEEVILRRRRVRDHARRVGRMIDELVDEESRIGAILESMNLSDAEKLILQILFTEESLEQGERVLQEHFGLQDGKKSIEEALVKARHGPREKRMPSRFH